MVSSYEMHRQTQAVAVMLAAIATSLFESHSVMADTSSANAQQDAVADQESADDSAQTNNGSDITRPQAAIEVRFSDLTSSNDRRQTNTAEMLLRMSSKITLAGASVCWPRFQSRKKRQPLLILPV
jgi:hypothetical protein